MGRQALRSGDGHFDVAIIGGGLAGLTAAACANAMGANAVIVDAGVPGTQGGLGGFAPFSGAKFSLYPAGSGLAALVGGEEALLRRYADACTRFDGLGFPQFRATDAQIRGDEAASGDLTYRRYHSIVLSPDEVADLLGAMCASLSRTEIIRQPAVAIELSSGPPFLVRLEGGDTVGGRTLVVASGRLGSKLLQVAGVPETEGKGLDIGVRLEFDNREPLTGLRELGPDAKIIANDVRTFCLNSPGRIFHYPGLGFQLPGGIVAEQDWPRSNVGILHRLPDRVKGLAAIAARAPSSVAPAMEQIGCGPNLGWTQQSRQIFGSDVVSRIDHFVSTLVSGQLITFPEKYTVHFPLLDWHWPVFSLPGTLSTSVPGVFAAGDSSGHARGLMQAVVMGALAAEQALA